jgi:hypothetical protein
LRVCRGKAAPRASGHSCEFLCGFLYGRKEGRNRPLGIRDATLLPKAPLWKECIERTGSPGHIHDDEVYTKRFLRLFIDLNIRKSELHALL